MSDVDAFWRKVATSGALARELDALMDDDVVVPAPRIVALAARHGFRIGLEDLRESLSIAGETQLSERELDTITGGVELDHQGAYHFQLEISGISGLAEMRERVAF